MRIFSSGVYLRRAADFTVRTKDLVSSVRSSAATALDGLRLDNTAPLYELLYLIQGAHPTSYLSGFSARSSVPLSLTTYTQDYSDALLRHGVHQSVEITGVERTPSGRALRRASGLLAPQSAAAVFKPAARAPCISNGLSLIATARSALIPNRSIQTRNGSGAGLVANTILVAYDNFEQVGLSHALKLPHDAVVSDVDTDSMSGRDEG